MEYNKDKREIRSDRKLNDLDKFVLEFIKILEKHSKYVIVSGYVSILLGRSRSTEDVDLLIPNMRFDDFKEIFEDLLSNGFECANQLL